MTKLNFLEIQLFHNSKHSGFYIKIENVSFKRSLLAFLFYIWIREQETWKIICQARYEKHFGLLHSLSKEMFFLHLFSDFLDLMLKKRHLCHFFKSQFFVTKSPSGLLNGRKMSPALKCYKRYPPLPHIHSHLCIFFLWKNDEQFSLWPFLILNERRLSQDQKFSDDSN